MGEVRRRVSATGWTYIYSGFHDLPVGYGYTVGLTQTFDHPEAVVVGLAEEHTAYVFGELVAKLRAGERPIVNAAVGMGLNLPVVLRHVPPSLAAQHLWVASAFYEQQAFEAVQIVWPDAHGRFPWEAGHERKGNYQPLLTPGPTAD